MKEELIKSGYLKLLGSGEPNCLGYAIFVNLDAGIYVPYGSTSRFTIDYLDGFERGAKEANPNIQLRRIDNYNSPIELYEYRLAVRIPNNKYSGISSGRVFHVIYQLDSGEWVGKDNMDPSKRLGWGNPSTDNSMWENNAYPEACGTCYYAVSFK